MNSDVHSAEVDMTATAEKAVQLFTYLRELCGLRISHVRDLSQYDEVFWFEDIPHEKQCHCIAWRMGENREIAAEERSDIWVEIHKPTLKSPPEIPDELEQWINDDEVTDSSLEEPSLFSEIPITITHEGDTQANHTEIRALDDCPEIFELWMEYVERKWKPWAAEDTTCNRPSSCHSNTSGLPKPYMHIEINNRPCAEAPVDQNSRKSKSRL